MTCANRRIVFGGYTIARANRRLHSNTIDGHFWPGGQCHLKLRVFLSTRSGTNREMATMPSLQSEKMQF